MIIEEFQKICFDFLGDYNLNNNSKPYDPIRFAYLEKRLLLFCRCFFSMFFLSSRSVADVFANALIARGKFEKYSIGDLIEKKAPNLIQLFHDMTWYNDSDFQAVQGEPFFVVKGDIDDEELKKQILVIGGMLLYAQSIVGRIGYMGKEAVNITFHENKNKLHKEFQNIYFTTHAQILILFNLHNYNLPLVGNLIEGNIDKLPLSLNTPTYAEEVEGRFLRSIRTNASEEILKSDLAPLEKLRFYKDISSLTDRFAKSLCRYNEYGTAIECHNLAMDLNKKLRTDIKENSPLWDICIWDYIFHERNREIIS